MSIAIAIAILLIAVVVVVIFFTNIGGDYSKRTDQQLLDLWSLHENNVRAARSVGPEAHKKAVEKMSTLTSEMKKRGLLRSDYTQESESLDSLSRKLFSRGLDEIKSLAKANDAVALYQLGMIFRGVKELSTSIKYMTDSANLGYADAQYALGWAFMTEGSGVTRNACDTMKWFKIAAEQGHVEAAKALDVALKSFSKVEADAAFSEAEKWLARKNSNNEIKSEQLAASVTPEVQITPDRAHHEGAKIQNDDRKMTSLIIKAAEQGRVSAQCHLGTMYIQGRGVQQSYEQAAEWFLKAAEQGNMTAQFNLGELYNNGQGVARDAKKAIDWYRKAAEQGMALAQFVLGQMYLSGHGVIQDEQQAIDWYCKAAEQGMEPAQFNLGQMYYKGQCVTQNYREAANWYRKAAEQGDAEAQSILGEMFTKGQGVTQNYREAANWYRKAAEQGLAVTQFNLGELYRNGQGVAQDNLQAASWFSKAAEQGLAVAQYNFGALLYNGQGVTKDCIEGYKWIAIASKGGDAAAIRNINAVEKMMTTDQVSEARQRASAWMAKRH